MTLQLHDASGTGTIEFENSGTATIVGDKEGITSSVPITCTDFRLTSASDDPAEAGLVGLMAAIKGGFGSAHSASAGVASSSRGDEAGSNAAPPPPPPPTIEGMLAALVAKVDDAHAKIRQLEAKVESLERAPPAFGSGDSGSGSGAAS